jgi:hypothetical protein
MFESKLWTIYPLLKGPSIYYMYGMFLPVQTEQEKFKNMFSPHTKY